MKKQAIIIGIIVLLICVGLSGCIEESTSNGEEPSPHEGDLRLTSIELLGGKYNASILYEEIFRNDNWSNTEIRSIVYTKDGEKYIGNYNSYLREALDWIKSNTSENVTILCWWEYGHMIEGYIERNAVAKFPYLAIKDNPIWEHWTDERWIRDFAFKWTSNETIQDIAKVLTSTNISSNETRELINKYNVSYILIHGGKTCWDTPYIFDALGINLTESGYIEQVGGNLFRYTEKANETLIFKMWDKGYSFGSPGNLEEPYLEEPQIPGLQLCYISSPYITAACSDTRIFKVL